MKSGLTQVNMVFIGSKNMLVGNSESYDTKSKMIATLINAMPSVKSDLGLEISTANNRMVKTLFDNSDTFTNWTEENEDVECFPIILCSK